MNLAPVDTWPDVRLTLHLLPWTWRLAPLLWRDDVTPTVHFAWLFIEVEFLSDKPMFRHAPDRAADFKGDEA